MAFVVTDDFYDKFDIGTLFNSGLPVVRPRLFLRLFLEQQDLRLNFH